VISRSQIDVQPVFDAIVRNAVRCVTRHTVTCIDSTGAMVHFVAHHNFHPEQLVRWAAKVPPSAGGGIGRVIETRGVVCVADVHPVMAPSRLGRVN